MGRRHMEPRDGKEKELVKVQFYDPDIGYENLWATELEKGRYRIESIPFFIYDISRDDIIAASPDDDGKLKFGRVLKPSGNRTLRARSEDFVEDTRLRRKITATLKKHGCDVEELRSRLLAIHVPHSVELRTITEYLTNDARVQWEYGNPVDLNKNANRVKQS
jgi:hypothetical protein